MDGLDGLSDIYSSYSDIYGKDNLTSKKLKNTIENTDYSQSTDEEIMDACKQFEAYFVEQAFKALSNMVPDNEATDGEYMKYFGDNLVQEYAKSATEQGDGMGIAKMLYEQMKRNYSDKIVSATDAYDKMPPTGVIEKD